MLPIAEMLLELVVHSFGKCHLQEEDKFIPYRGAWAYLVWIFQCWRALTWVGIFGIRDPFSQVGARTVGDVCQCSCSKVESATLSCFQPFLGGDLQRKECLHEELIMLSLWGKCV